MSRFGAKMNLITQVVDDEMCDDFLYFPRTDIPNAESIPDVSRAGGPCRAIVLQPGVKLGGGPGLTSMHNRSSANVNIWFRARDLLADVRTKDRFSLAGPESNPDRPEVYEVADGPRPYGFGWMKVEAVEIPRILEDGTPVPLPEVV